MYVPPRADAPNAPVGKEITRQTVREYVTNLSKNYIQIVSWLVFPESDIANLPQDAARVAKLTLDRVKRLFNVKKHQQDPPFLKFLSSCLCLSDVPFARRVKVCCLFSRRCAFSKTHINPYSA